MTSIAEPVQNLSLVEKVCLPPHLAAFSVFYEKPKKALGFSRFSISRMPRLVRQLFPG